jgi:hypothetical protein
MNAFTRIAVALLSIGSLAYVPAADAAPPVETPLFEQFQDINPCTGELITLTFTGVAVIHEVGDMFHLRGYGQVITSDGYSGTFNRTFFFKGDQVATLRFHDMEVNSVTGQRVVVSVIVHMTIVDGIVRSDLTHFSGPRCVGRPSP